MRKAIWHFSPRTGVISKLADGIEEHKTADEARTAWMALAVGDHNLAFQRLATCHDFDVKACIEWYDREAAKQKVETGC